jgi:hypothetical protein
MSDAVAVAGRLLPGLAIMPAQSFEGAPCAKPITIEGSMLRKQKARSRHEAIGFVADPAQFGGGPETTWQ